MASPSSGLDVPEVNLKICFQGDTRKFRLPLSDMVANTLEKRIRDILDIPAGSACLLERFSDSACAYVVLDPTNIPVYKQLYRAARAKSKLKLRVAISKPIHTEDAQDDTEDAQDVATNATNAEPAPVSIEDVPESEPEPEPKPAPAKSPRDIASSSIPSYQKTSQQEPHVSYIKPDELSKVETTDASNNLPIVLSSALSPHPFAVCCNSCDRNIPDTHYHCSTCDDGDFDLCPACVDQGITCHGPSHWLIKRHMINGNITSSNTETIAPKPTKVKSESKKIDVTLPKLQLKAQPKPERKASDRVVPVISKALSSVTGIRTCNGCIRDFFETNFLHCAVCEDFDLCKDCFAKDSHGHNPKHGFAPAIQGLAVPDHIAAKLKPGRNIMHNAICDGCEKFIAGIRHKCLDCPDFDFCSECLLNAKFIHAQHRFVPVYEPLTETYAPNSHVVHQGICCDGPLCSSGRSSYITGIRYKCAVCHDTDFCANCEATPHNTHNKTHPLIKFKTPVRHVSVTTNGENEDGQKMLPMGDRYARQTTSSRTTETASNSSRISVQNVQTVVDVTPVQEQEPKPAEQESGSLSATKTAIEKAIESIKNNQVKEQAKEKPKSVSAPSEYESAPASSSPKTESRKSSDAELRAMYVRDTITDGTVMSPNHVFEQTWVLENMGNVAWPAGCSVKLVGGDYMCHLDSNRPVGISELASASESTTCYRSLMPGEQAPFTVLLRTPSREGRFTSYWRLSSPNGHKFGDRLWCEVVVDPSSKKAAAAEEAPQPPAEKKENAMIFPKLEKESPAASVHEEACKEAPAKPTVGEADDFEECGELGEWDDSDEGFLTDEEYDILDASDEEYLMQHQQQQKVNKN